MLETLPAAVQRHAAARPDDPALMWRGGVVGYGELADRMRIAASAVARTAPGSIGLSAEKSPATVAFVLGCLAAGRPAVLPSRTLPGPTLTELFARAGAVAVPDHHVERPATDPGGDPQAADEGGEHATAFVLTTSGSTGVPKLVPLTVGAVERFAAWAHDRFDLGPGRRVLNYAPLNFDLCLLEVWATLRHGGCVVLVDPVTAARGAALLTLLDTTEPHVVQAVPLCYELIATAADRGRTLSSVRHAIVTGYAMPPARIPRLRTLFDRATLHNVYGCTETNDSFHHELRPGDQDLPALPLGVPLPGVGADLVDGDEIVTGAGVGELVVRTPFQSPGYHAPTSPDTAFGPHPARPDGRSWFRTGDLVRRDASGDLFLTGRTDFRVKVRGQQVHLEHVEAVLLANSDVLEAAAVAIADEQAGHRLHATVRRRDGSGLDSLTLRSYLARRLAPAAIPATLHVGSDPLPRTATGKVDRRLIESAQKR